MRLALLATGLLLCSACRRTADSDAGPDARALLEDAASPDASAYFDSGSNGVMPEDASGGSSDASAQPDSARDATSRRLFNGVDLSGFRYDPAVWRVENGAIVASAQAGAITENTFLIHDTEFADFVLTGELWVGVGGNSGVQYRSRLLASETYRVLGYQMDGADGYWGALYEEGGRGLLSGSGCLDAAKSETWLRFTIRALGNQAVHEIEGKECSRFVDEAPQQASAGLFALQYHVPGGFEVRFRELIVTEL